MSSVCGLPLLLKMMSVGVFPDVSEPIDFGPFFPFTDKAHKDGYKYMNNLAVKNIGCGC
jgi:hypothetical protein